MLHLYSPQIDEQPDQISPEEQEFEELIGKYLIEIKEYPRLWHEAMEGDSVYTAEEQEFITIESLPRH
jgi:hypothetical protein